MHVAPFRTFALTDLISELYLCALETFPHKKLIGGLKI